MIHIIEIICGYIANPHSHFLKLVLGRQSQVCLSFQCSLTFSFTIGSPLGIQSWCWVKRRPANQFCCRQCSWLNAMMHWIYYHWTHKACIKEHWSSTGQLGPTSGLQPDSRWVTTRLLPSCKYMVKD